MTQGLQRGWPLLVAAFLLTFPLYGTNFQISAVAAQALVLGIVALSLTFLAGYGGMVSLAQTGIYGLAGYTVGIMTVSHSYPWWLSVIAALVVATATAFLFGVISVRSQGIYFLMITLAIGQVVYNFAQQNYTIFNGHGGINGERAPTIGGLSFDPILHPKSFYYLCLAVAAACYFGLRYIVRSPFGLALQGVRDNPRRMRALGYWVEGTRVAAFSLAGFVAGIGGVLGVWYYATMSPGSIDLTRTLNILIMAVIGGLIYFEGAFVGAFIWVLLNTFVTSLSDITVGGFTFSPNARYSTVIGLVFLLIVLFSPNGAIGLAQAVTRFGGRVVRPVKRSTVPTARQEATRETGPPSDVTSGDATTTVSKSESPLARGE